MTLQAFFESISQNPTPAIGYMLFVPLTAGLASLFAKNEGHLSPWKFLYSGLIYLSTIPGIFALALNAYLFLFERQPILLSVQYLYSGPSHFVHVADALSYKKKCRLRINSWIPSTFWSLSDDQRSLSIDVDSGQNKIICLFLHAFFASTPNLSGYLFDHQSRMEQNFQGLTLPSAVQWHSNNLVLTIFSD